MLERKAMSDTEHHPDPNPVRPSSAEGDPDEVMEEQVDLPAHASQPDPHIQRPSQAEGEADED